MDGEVVLYKRWLLRPGVQPHDVVHLVRTQVVPRYRDLSTNVTLELHVVDETAVLAVQRWTSRAELDAALAPGRFSGWWEGYLATLRRWDELVVFDAEWETESPG